MPFRKRPPSHRGTGATVAATVLLLTAGASALAPASHAASAFTVSIHAPSAVVVPHAMRVYGAVTPARSGETVVLQRYYSGAWHSLSTHTLTSTGAYSFSFVPHSVGTYSFRVHKGRDSRNASANSRSVFPRGVAPAAPAWKSHSGVVAGHPIVLRLSRPVRETCTLKITNPARTWSRSWSYAAGAGLIEFGITPPTSTANGSWRLASTCAPVHTTVHQRAVTALVVSGAKNGSAFLTSKSGPVINVPIKSGSTGLTSSSASVGGKGGAVGDDYPYRGYAQDSGFDPWREYYRECTSFVAWALHSRNNFEMPFYANAIDWGPKAAARGYAVNTTPAIGSVAWSNRGYYGHVAWVADVQGSNVVIEEYNEYGNGVYSSRTLPSTAFSGYIHFADRPAAPLPPPPPPGGTTPPPPTPTPTPQPAPATTWSETTGGVAHTWTDYTSAGGTQGQSVAANQTVQISCRLTGFTVADGNNWWYLIASGPWDNAYYVSADAFYNNGQTSGSLLNTPFVDTNVAVCNTSAPPPPPPPPATTWSETVGGVTHTWTDYSSAGGTQGQSISAFQTVQVACKVSGFRVADGDTWWYKIASSPWNGSFYASADAFYNNGATSGSLSGTPFVDSNVPNC